MATRAFEQEVFVTGPASVPLYCPMCGKRHVDVGESATRQHSTHVCVDDPAGRGCGVSFVLRDARDAMPLYYFGSPEGVGT